MATIEVYEANMNRIGEVTLSDTVFNAEIKRHLVHDAVRLQLMNRRAGTVAVKNRAAVSGGGKKPFKQKGTGQARQGCSRAPQYPGGGVAFGPQQKNYSLSMNKKAHKAALRSVLSSYCQDRKLLIVKEWTLPEVSTKKFVSLLNSFSLDRALLIVDTFDENLYLSARNVKNVKVITSDSVNVYDILSYKNVIATEAAIKKLDGVLQP